MVLDYSERRQAAKVNRPRRQPVGFYTLLALVLFGGVFALGVFTGWYLYHPGGRLAKLPPPAVSSAQAKPAAPVAPVVPVPAANAPAPANPRAEVPLTFYETLPKGSKGLIGTGLNPKRPEGAGKPGHGEEKLVAPPAPTPETPASPVPAPKGGETGKGQPQVKQAEQTKPAAAPKPDQKGAPVKQGEAAKQPAPAKAPEPARQPAAAPKADAKAAPAKQPDAAQPAAAGKPADKSAKFCVQVASYRDRKEADEVRSKLEAKGIAAYVSESKVEGKGSWYRVRIGRRLSQQEADSLAGRLGKGVMVVPD